MRRDSESENNATCCWHGQSSGRNVCNSEILMESFHIPDLWISALQREGISIDREGPTPNMMAD